MEYKMVEDFCKEYKLTIDQFYGRKPSHFLTQLDTLKTLPDGFNPIVIHNLWLDSLIELPKGFNPIVNGHLSLKSLKHIPEGFNPVVRCGLVLDSIEELPEGFNPIVGGILKYNKNIKINHKNIIAKLNNGYIKVADKFGTLLEETDKYFKIKQLNNKDLYICYKDNIFGYGEYLPEAMINLKNSLNRWLNDE